MTQVMQGIRVLELAAWTFVPAAGAVLADWGADVIKVELPGSGDPQRGLVTSSLMGGSASNVNYLIEQPNRNKRSLSLDLKAPGGRDLLLQLAARSDVFLTNWLEPARTKLGLDVEDIRAVNPSIIYVRGSSHGPIGPDSHRGSFDSAAVWSRSGVASAITPPGEYPITQPAAYNDLAGGQTIAGGIAAALLHRERTGEGSVVDVSLLGLGMWLMSAEIVMSRSYGLKTPKPRGDRSESPNPLVGNYRCRDGRFVQLMMLQSDRYWTDFCHTVGRPDWAQDERFTDGARRYQNRTALVALIDALFAERDLAEWRTILAELAGAWAPVQTAYEVGEDPQAIANGYTQTVSKGDLTFPLVANPVRFDGDAPELRPAPETGQHTEEILLELGYSWADIAILQENGAV
jgi:crotonobetainyl-CoA:carnitine CoA-transferase CaiB-like acyl-CoA transferase